jgi:hypothetical protein
MNICLEKNFTSKSIGANIMRVPLYLNIEGHVPVPLAPMRYF